MNKTIKVKNITVSYDLDEILRQIDSLSADDEYEVSDDETGAEYRMTEDEFNEAKIEFKDNVSKLDSEDKIEDLFLSNVTITKAGQVARNRNQIILNSGITINYDNEYGSHSYDSPCLVVINTGNNTAEIVYEEVGQQDSF